MIICFQCSSETKRLLDRLLETRSYNDYSEAIAVSIANQSLLHNRMGTGGTFVLKTEAVSETGSGPVCAASSLQRRSEATISGELSVPEIFTLEGVSDGTVSCAPSSADDLFSAPNVPIERWLLGQYNRLLPAKVNCRALLHYLREGRDGVALPDVEQEIAAAATRLGEILRFHDRRERLDRDEALSTAFPSAIDDADKSRRRYINQFLGTVNSQRQISGLLAGLKLINLAKQDQPRVALTDAGLCFALLSNPVLDEGHGRVVRKFSSEETEFLLDHVAQSVPSESFAYRTILTAIKTGANTPEKIAEVLRREAPPSMDRGLTESFIASQRSGAISRMCDLDLVRRLRQGVRVTYAITEPGDRFLSRRTTRRHGDHGCDENR